MSNYFDNQNRWSWTVTDKSVKVETDHGSHTHSVDVSKATLNDMYTDTGRTMGNAHRSSTHDKK